MRVTINDVAKAAGVSHQTVSKVVNGKGRVSDKTRESVLKVCDELGYVPSALARHLAGSKNLNVGIAFFEEYPSFARFTYTRIFHGVFEELARRGRDVFLAHVPLPPVKERSEENLRESRSRFHGLLLGGMVGSVILTGDVQDCHWEILRKSKMDAIYVTNGDVPQWLGQVDVNPADICRSLFACLNVGVCTRVLYAHVPPGDTVNVLDRDLWPVFRDQAAAAGLLVEPAPGDPLEICRMAAQADKGRTAVVCVNDLLASRIVDAARKNGFAIPNDFCITGMGNTEPALSVQPAITTIDFNFEEMGRKAVELLLDNEPGARAHVDCRAVLRESLRPAI